MLRRLQLDALSIPLLGADGVTVSSRLLSILDRFLDNLTLNEHRLGFLDICLHLRPELPIIRVWLEHQFHHNLELLTVIAPHLLNPILNCLPMNSRKVVPIALMLILEQSHLQSNHPQCKHI